jgi:hypothetical protein
MPQKRCSSCGAVGPRKEGWITFERSGILKRFLTTMCATCWLSLVHVVDGQSEGSQDGLPMENTATSRSISRRLRARRAESQRLSSDG